MFYKYILFIDKILGIQKAKWNTERFPIHASVPLTNDLPISRITSDNLSPARMEQLLYVDEPVSIHMDGRHFTI